MILQQKYHNQVDRFALVFGGMFFLGLIAFCLIFFKERMFYYDSAASTFKLLNFEEFAIPASRYSKAIVQILPLAFIKLGASLKSSVQAYSVSYALLYALLFYLASFRLKNIGAGLLIIVVLVVGYRNGFYYSTTETPQGLAYLALLVAWLQYNRNSTRSIFSFLLVSLCISLLAYWSHPISLFPFLFLLGYELIDSKAYRNPRIYVLASIILSLYVLKFLFTPSESYEGGFFSSFTEMGDILLNPDLSKSYGFMSRHLNSLYQLSWIWLLVISLYFILTKNFLKLGYYLFSVFAFFFVLIVTFKGGDSAMAMQKNILPMSFFIFMPLLLELFNAEKDGLIESFGKLALLIVLTLSVVDVFEERKVYERRVAYLTKMVEYSENRGEKKLLIEREFIKANIIGVEYALSVETLLLSSIHGPGSSATIHYVKESQPDEYTTEEIDVFYYLPYWSRLGTDELNPKYFSLPSSPYSRVESFIEP